MYTILITNTLLQKMQFFDNMTNVMFGVIYVNLRAYAGVYLKALLKKVVMVSMRKKFN